MTLRHMLVIVGMLAGATTISVADGPERLTQVSMAPFCRSEASAYFQLRMPDIDVDPTPVAGDGGWIIAGTAYLANGTTHSFVCTFSSDLRFLVLVEPAP